MENKISTDSPREAVFAVLTGDIVDSKKVSERTDFDLHQLLDQGSDTLQQLYPGTIPLPLDIFRWDSWQLLIYEPWLCLRIGLTLRCILQMHAPLRGFDTRIAFGIGTVRDFPASRVSHGDGQAFRESGSLLDSLSGSQRMAFGCPVCEDAILEKTLQAVVILIDSIASTWTTAQSQAVLGALQDLTQSATGARWQPAPISQQAVAQHLQSARFVAVEKALQTFEQALQTNLNTNHPAQAS